jgi:hypothetical protein
MGECLKLPFPLKKEKKNQIKICILEGNENFEKREFAYFLRKIREKGSFTFS